MYNGWSLLYIFSVYFLKLVQGYKINLGKTAK